MLDMKFSPKTGQLLENPRDSVCVLTLRPLCPFDGKHMKETMGRNSSFQWTHFGSHATFERFGSLCCCSRNLNGSEFISIYFVLLCALLENLEMSCNLVGGGFLILVRSNQFIGCLCSCVHVKDDREAASWGDIRSTAVRINGWRYSGPMQARVLTHVCRSG